MENLITTEQVYIAFGLKPLLDHVDFTLFRGERVCLIGRNGEGKSTFMKLIAGEIQPDSGKINRAQQLKVASLQQQIESDKNSTVFDFVAEGLSDIGKVLKDYHHLIDNFSDNTKNFNELETLQRKIDAVNGWDYDRRIQSILTTLELDPHQTMGNLSGGWQKRAALAKALVSDPDVLLLDEPTNHLDIEGIQWLENQLLTLPITLLFITHDRSLLKKLATRIVELDRGKLTSWPGDYDNFLRRKEEMLHAENKQNADFDKKLAIEEKWIRQGIKARRTRNEGRVRALERMREERQARRAQQGKAALNIEVKNSGKIVIEAENVTHYFDNRCVINNFSTVIERGDKIGLIGPNGCGKTTLLNILLKKLEPTSGTVKHGTQLHIRYFDQLRQTLDYTKNVIDNVAEGTDTIEINGAKKHIIQYLKDFLFTPERALSPLKALSGGECNRLLLAKLFSQPANLLVLDEPTNDLDIETLELLEELLIEYSGTLLVVSHDREFLDNVITSTIIFEGEGKVMEYVGGYRDWQVKQKTVAVEKQQVVSRDKKSNVKTKLSFNEQQSLKSLPQQIEKLEREIEMLQKEIAHPDFYQKDHVFVTEKLKQLEQIQVRNQEMYEQWEALEAKQK